MFPSFENLAEGLRGSGYIADSIATTTVYLAARLQKPLLLEGPAGSGKTQLAYAVAEAANTSVERLQCYEGINEEKAIGKFDEPLQRLCVELKAKCSSVDWESLQTELHRQQFFSAGPLLRALQFEKPCVLRSMSAMLNSPSASSSKGFFSSLQGPYACVCASTSFSRATTKVCRV